MITGIVRRATSRSRVVILVTILLGVIAAAVGSTLLAKMTNDSDSPNAQSVLTSNRLTQAAGMSADIDVIAIVTPKGGPDSDAGRRRVSDVGLAFYINPDVAKVSSYLNTPNPSLISKDGKSTIVSVQFKSGINRDALSKAISAEFKDQPDVALGGVGITGEEIGGRVAEDLSKAEIFALPLLFLLALWIFRGVIAASLTIAIGVLAIVCTLTVLRGVVEITSISSYVLNLVTGLGLGLAIDYCLFIMSRYREETVRYGYTPKAALVAGVTAGRTVMFSALTVAASLSSLMLFPQKFLFSMGVGGTAVTLVSASVCIVVLPAALVLVGKRIDSLALPGSARARRKDTGAVEEVVWYKLSKWVMRHAVPVLIVSLIVIAALAWPALSTKFSNINVTSLPANSAVRVVAERVADDFPNSGGTTINVALLAAKDDTQDVTDYGTAISKVPNAHVYAPPRYLGQNTWQVDAVVYAGPFTSTAEKAVSDVRALKAPFKTLVGGETAAFVDNEDLMISHLPLASLVVALAVLLVIFLLTGSIVLPIKTLLVNLLNVSMTVGVLVWIFQYGHLEWLLHYKSTGAIDLSQPILVTVIGFGLSTDYGVFLLARIKETYDHTGDNVEAVATGVGRSGRIISSAALMLCVAVGAFSTSTVLFIKQLGVGVAVAVLLDATLIRAFLVPSAMRLMSTANWWAPPFLRRVHERFGISEAGDEPADDSPRLVLIPSPPPVLEPPLPQLTLIRSALETQVVTAGRHGAQAVLDASAVVPTSSEAAQASVAAAVEAAMADVDRRSITRTPTPPEVTGEQPVVHVPRHEKHRRAVDGSGGKHRR